MVISHLSKEKEKKNDFLMEEKWLQKVFRNNFHEYGMLDSR